MSSFYWTLFFLKVFAHELNFFIGDGLTSEKIFLMTNILLSLQKNSECDLSKRSKGSCRTPSASQVDPKGNVLLPVSIFLVSHQNLVKV